MNAGVHQSMSRNRKVMLTCPVTGVTPIFSIAASADYG